MCVYIYMYMYIYLRGEEMRATSLKTGTSLSSIRGMKEFSLPFFFFFFLLMDNPFMRFMRFLLPLLASVSDGSRVMSLFFLDLCTLHFSLRFVENFVTLAS